MRYVRQLRHTPHGGAHRGGVGEPADGSSNASVRRVDLAGCPVEVISEEDAVSAVLGRVAARRGPPLGVLSINLDHLHHFGDAGRWRGVLQNAEQTGAVQWLSLLDGAPLIRQVERLTGGDAVRVAGSDLIGPLLDGASAVGVSVGFLGGTDETHTALRRRLAEQWPPLRVAGCWSPSRQVIADSRASSSLAIEIAETGVEMLVVCLGKPRQELWIAEHGQDTGAGVLLAFGAVVEFLAGRVSRAPRILVQSGLEWAYRLALEPRRLARRYLLEGPPAYARLRTSSSVELDSAGSVAAGDMALPEPSPVHVDVAAVVVTYNSESLVGDLIADHRREAGQLRLKTVVVDNNSSDGTRSALAAVEGITVISSAANLGYAGGRSDRRSHT